MSIVLDALNKAEKEKTNSGIFRKYDETKIGEIKTSYNKKIKILFLLNLFAILGIGALGALYLNRPSPEKQMEPLKKENPVQEPIKPKVVSVSPVPQEEFIIYKNHLSITGGPEIIINGSFTDKNETYLLIGSEMVKKGELINGVQIVDITPKIVKAKYKGKFYEIPT